MNAIPSITFSNEEIEDAVTWRRALHRIPEIAYEEHDTSAFVAARLKEFGLEVRTGLGGTGVVGTLRRGTSSRVIGLRADMDALAIEEASGVAYASTRPGRMHACGHDGHMAMLLAAARRLARSEALDGTVHFIFQPAEENEGGAARMIADGLFRDFPVDSVFGMHNWPGLPLGRAGLTTGAMMAAFGIFDITVTGRGAHGGMPHQGIDPIACLFQIGSALQTIASRNVSPMASSVVSVTTVHGGDAWNVIPDSCRMTGTVRWFDPAVGDLIETRLRAIAEGVAAAMGCTVTIDYQRRYPPTINDADEARFVQGVLRDMPGLVLEETVEPSMGAEDFAFMLNERPGAYLWVGQGTPNHTAGLHSPRYDFNDDALPLGAAVWVALAERKLAPA
ncbi:M20 aminoacylase family protein [Prosthecomicrobium hirschii]|uniref:M20 aminoacylase family protein n=1 Tax=Prosthecodimorpha hirschii TaxID=665126 RepID=UPI002220FFA6|nr:M20 aminoacylase family protein [Prosthecomicrobium hirschii]MCW1842673.1 M20 family metallopeptidase [Prosthecomicrobium hirschii]